MLPFSLDINERFLQAWFPTINYQLLPLGHFGSWPGQVPGGFSQIPGSATMGQVPSVGGTLTWLAVVSRRFVWILERLGGFRRCRVVSGKPGWFQERLCVS